jgi:ribonuclease R
MAAERDTPDRYLAAYLSDRVGTEMPGKISGVQRFGAFVKLDETGADGLIPIRSIGREYFLYDAASQTLMGSDSGMTLRPGQKVTVRLTEAVPVTGGLMLELLEVDGAAMPAGQARPGGRGRRPGPPRGRAPGKRRVERKRR